MRAFLVVVAVAGCAHAARVAEPPCGAGWSPLGGRTGGDAFVLDRGAPDEKITSVRVEGVPHDLARTLASVIATHRGQTFADAPIHDDLRRLWALGIARDIRVERRGGDAAFIVDARRVVGTVVTAGDRDPLRRFTLLRGAPFEPERIARVATAVEQGYVREGYADARMRVGARTQDGAVDVCVVASLGSKVTIASLTFPGATVPATELAAAIHGGESTNHVGGVLDAGALETDNLFLTAALYDRGYPMARVKSARITRAKSSFAIEIPIEPGDKFHLGRIAAPWAVTAHDLASGEVFSRKRIADARERMETELGVSVLPITKMDLPARRIHVTFEPQWRWPWDALAYWSSHLP